MVSRPRLLNDVLRLFRHDLLRRWYPLVVDRECGGYYTNITSDWMLPAEQEKMIVTQARHVWTTSKAALFTDDGGVYEPVARHGYTFLRDVMWDHEHGGFYQIRNRQGGLSDVRGWREEKRTYGNAFGVYALAAFFRLTQEPEVLELARRAFTWIEEHAFDSLYGGYFQFLTREGNTFDTTSAYKTIASDGNEVGYKDQNSSIHLLEGYAELYAVWKDPGLRERLLSLLTLIRDRMVAERGYLQLFFHRDLTPLSFRDAPEAERAQNYGLDHISFGHDYETAFLMLEASHALGLQNDVRTLAVARRMLDHALENGWDDELGGFYDGGYYFRGEEQCRIIKDTKNWWAQAEGLNALLLFSRIFPEDTRYEEYFIRQWGYVTRFILDHERGDGFEGGIDKEPEFRKGPKSHIWKCTYHTGRALMNCITLLAAGDEPALASDRAFWKAKGEMDEFIHHWRSTAAMGRTHPPT